MVGDIGLDQAELGGDRGEGVLDRDEVGLCIGGPGGDRGQGGRWGTAGRVGQRGLALGGEGGLGGAGLLDDGGGAPEGELLANRRADLMTGGGLANDVFGVGEGDLAGEGAALSRVDGGSNRVVGEDSQRDVAIASDDDVVAVSRAASNNSDIRNAAVLQVEGAVGSAACQHQGPSEATLQIDV